MYMSGGCVHEGEPLTCTCREGVYMRESLLRVYVHVGKVCVPLHMYMHMWGGCVSLLTHTCGCT